LGCSAIAKKKKNSVAGNVLPRRKTLGFSGRRVLQWAS